MTKKELLQENEELKSEIEHLKYEKKYLQYKLSLYSIHILNGKRDKINRQGEII